MKRKILIAVSAPTKHGKSHSLKLLAKYLFDEADFKKVYSYCVIENAGKMYEEFPHQNDRLWEKGDWTVTFYDKKGGSPRGYIVTAGDNIHEAKLKDRYDDIISQPTLDFVVGACRTANNVYQYLEKIDTKKFAFVKLSPSYLQGDRTKTELDRRNQDFAKELKDLVMRLCL